MTDTRDPEDPKLERLDLLLSASLDDEVGADERAELANLRAGAEGETAERERAFREVDEELRALAGEPLDDAQLSNSLADLDAHLEARREGREASGASSDPSGFGAGPGLGARRLAIGLAAAAAVVFYLIVPSVEPPVEGTDSFPDARAVDPGVDAFAIDEGDDPSDFEEGDAVEDLVLAIGYGEENAEIGVIMGDDFEVIEQLELLDYLIALDGEGRG